MIEKALQTVRTTPQTKGEIRVRRLAARPRITGPQPEQRGTAGGHVRHPKDGVRYRYTEYFDYDPLNQVQKILMDFEHPTQKAKSFVTPLTQRQFFPEELRALLHYNGFKVATHNGDFAGGALTSESESQIIVARRVKCSL